MQRVFISGVGLVCPLGNDRKTVWQQLLAGQSGVAQLTQIDVSDLEVKIGGEVRNFDPKIVEVNERTAARKMDRASLFAVAAALQALDDAGLAEHSLGRHGAVVVGAGLSGLLTLQEQTENLLRGGPRKVSPMTIPLLMPNAAAANICIATGFKGPAYTVSSACASSGTAVVWSAATTRASSSRAESINAESRMPSSKVLSYSKCSSGALKIVKRAAIP